MTSTSHTHQGHDHSAHGHTHGGHGHGHAHAPANFDRAFAVGVTLNVGFVIAEVIFGVRAHSLALVSDAGHNLSDVFGLVLAWVAMRATRAAPTARRTYGFHRSTIYAALGNAGLLLLATGAVMWEAIRRLRQPEPVVANTMMWVAAIGIVVNAAAAAMFMANREHDVNVRGAFAHMAADAVVSLGVVLAGLAIRATGWVWLDPVVSIGISIAVLVATWGLLRESLNLAMDAVPEHIEPEEVEAYLKAIPCVADVHDLHIWAMSTSDTALTAHLVTPAGGMDDALLAETARELRARFRIGHTTLQLEHGDAEHPCAQEPAESV